VDHEVIIIGAGVCGIYQLHRLRELGVDVTVLEAGDDLGGTWYWNRYPGCRFDSESYSYGYSFSKELLAEWEWSEHFAGQPETLRYLNYVADKFDLRPHMQFGVKVRSAMFDEQTSSWRVHLHDGRELTCSILMTAIGMLSAATMPRIDGIEDFGGEWFHTYHWPHEPVDLTDKKVAVIGTGATGVQVISAIADQVGELFVFQRRPNWCAPLHNSAITPTEMAEIAANYEQIFATCARTPGGFLHGPDPRSFYEVSAQERYAFWEELYDKPGFAIWLSNFREILMEEGPNAEFSEYIASKIRERITDPEVAEKLIPKDHGFGVHRVPMETRYYEAYNLPTTHLIDINEAPIVRITPTGIQTTDALYEVDLIIYATGFDAITGAFDRIEFIGEGGQRLADKWRDGPITYLGAQVAGFPNLITLAGPQGASVSTNFPRAIETAVDWTTELIAHMRAHGLSRVECTPAAEEAWVDEVIELYSMVLLRKARSWFTGYNSNVEGHDKVRYMIYNGGAPRYRKRLAEIAANSYEGFVLS
jgi:cation diffusion facilitator CzcD-associated flavoprotein CzcO